MKVLYSKLKLDMGLGHTSCLYVNKKYIHESTMFQVEITNDRKNVCHCFDYLTLLVTDFSNRE